MIEELQQIENIQEESNLIEFKAPKRPTWYLERYIYIKLLICIVKLQAIKSYLFA
jgi:hypothetical protein